MFRHLIESAYISKLDLIYAERALNSTAGTAFRLTKEILVTSKTLQEAENFLIQLTQSRKLDSANRLRKF